MTHSSDLDRLTCSVADRLAATEAHVSRINVRRQVGVYHDREAMTSEPIELDPLEARANELAYFLIDSNRKALRGCTYNRDTAESLARAVAWYMAAKGLSFDEESQPIVEASVQWRELDAFLYKIDMKTKRVTRNRSLSV